ncbi:hypothetical protein M3Y97_00818100 [Aphelenchoides bicaudatus]|nr:hypothetical protein M3Y97_00818100 [Aphelenchoides bicaudatus]
MLAPIVTKDMQLFPSRPIPAHVKNVRTRAQSLNDFTNSGNRNQQQQKVAQPVKQRHAVSTGNLTARSPPKGSVISAKRKPLDMIAEGVELASNNSSSNLGALPPVPSSSKLSKKDANGNTPVTDDYGKLIRCPAIDLAGAKYSPDQELCRLQELNRPETSMSTNSEPSTTNAKPDKSKSLVKLFSAAFKRPKASRCNQEADAHKKASTSSNEATAVP